MQTLPAEERRCMADVRAAGMSLAEFGALSSNVGLHTVTHFADRSSLREFKEAIWEALGCGVGCGNGVGDSHRHTPFGGRGGTHVVVSFNRTALKQTGEGHFSPLGGYSRRHSAVLVMVRIEHHCCCSLAQSSARRMLRDSSIRLTGCRWRRFGTRCIRQTPPQGEREGESPRFAGHSCALTAPLYTAISCSKLSTFRGRATGVRWALLRLPSRAPQNSRRASAPRAATRTRTTPTRIALDAPQTHYLR